MPLRLSKTHIKGVIHHYQTHGKVDHSKSPFKDAVLETDVFIAGSGPIGCGFARHIIENHQTARVFMADIGAQDQPIVGFHPKNSIKYQKDIDAFVNVIKGALQTISIPPSDTFIPTLYGQAWAPALNEPLVIYGHNPNQVPELNLKASAVTRVVGGMATHWTCACPLPHAEERRENPIASAELDELLAHSRRILHVTTDQYDDSIRHNTVLDALRAGTTRNIQPLPLAVRRRTDNPLYVTWSGSNTVLGDAVDSPRFTLSPETRVTQVIHDPEDPSKIFGALVRDLKTDTDHLILAKAFIITCGAVGTPQVLYNSGIRPWALGRFMTEQSLSFCQIVLKRELVDAVRTDPRWTQKVREHHEENPKDPLPIPFTDPEPQVTIPYSSEHPYHVQIHRDAFSYGDVGPKADPRLIVDVRFFGKQDIKEFNRVYFGPADEEAIPKSWVPGITDSYGMPQATFEWHRSNEDNSRDQVMMKEMCEIASVLGSFLPGSNPQFMDPGLVLHITGTTRIGTNTRTSVADPNSRVHGFQNLWVGGNGCIPDSTACNPTATSLAIALKAAGTIVDHLNETSS